MWGGGILTKSEDQPHALGYAPGQTLWSENIPFDNRLRGNTVWGFDRYLTWAVVAVIDPESGMPAFDTDMPRALNCTLYLVMSVWKQGNAHHYPFMTSVKQAGRTPTLPGTAITIRS